MPIGLGSAAIAASAYPRPDHEGPRAEIRQDRHARRLRSTRIETRSQAFSALNCLHAPGAPGASGFGAEICFGQSRPPILNFRLSVDVSVQRSEIGHSSALAGQRCKSSDFDASGELYSPRRLARGSGVQVLRHRSRRPPVVPTGSGGEQSFAASITNDRFGAGRTQVAFDSESTKADLIVRLALDVGTR